MYRTIPQLTTVTKDRMPRGAVGAGCAMLPLALYFTLFDVERATGPWVPVMVVCSVVAGFVGYATSRNS